MNLLDYILGTAATFIHVLYIFDCRLFFHTAFDVDRCFLMATGIYDLAERIWKCHCSHLFNFFFFQWLQSSPTANELKCQISYINFPCVLEGLIYSLRFFSAQHCKLGSWPLGSVPPSPLLPDFKSALTWMGHCLKITDQKEREVSVFLPLPFLALSPKYLSLPVDPLSWHTPV